MTGDELRPGSADAQERLEGIDTNTEMATLQPEAILDWAGEKVSREADACLISCTAIKSAPVIARLEQLCGLPVLTSNQSMMWHLLRSSGIEDQITGFGRLFAASELVQQNKSGRRFSRARQFRHPAVRARRPSIG
jgi:hypothetical protein